MPSDNPQMLDAATAARLARVLAWAERMMEAPPPSIAKRDGGGGNNAQFLGIVKGYSDDGMNYKGDVRPVMSLTPVATNVTIYFSRYPDKSAKARQCVPFIRPNDSAGNNETPVEPWPYVNAQNEVEILWWCSDRSVTCQTVGGSAVDAIGPEPPPNPQRKPGRA